MKVKQIGNALLAAALLSSPALVSDIELHEAPIQGEAVVYSVDAASDYQNAFSQGSPLLDWEKGELEELINDGVIADAEGYQEIRSDRERLMNLSEADFALELVSMIKGQEPSVSFDKGYYNTDMFTLMSDTQLLSITDAYYSTLIEEGMTDMSQLEDTESGVTMWYLNNILEDRGVNSIAHFDKAGADGVRNMLAEQKLGFKYSGYDIDSGMVDYQTQENVTVGEILFEGCICNNPEEPGEVTVIVSDYAVTDLRLTELSGVVGQDLAAQFSTGAISSYISGANSDGTSFRTAAGENGEHDFIFLNSRTLSSQIDFVKEGVDGVSESLHDDLVSFMVNGVIHHEIQHGKVIQEDYRAGSHDRVRAVRQDFRAGNIESDFGINELTTHVMYDTKMFLEMNANIHGAAEGLQQWLKHHEGTTAEKVEFVDAVLALAKKEQDLHNHNAELDINRTMQLKEHLFDPIEKWDALDMKPVERETMLKMRSYLSGESQEKIDKTFDSMAANLKNPYQSYHGVQQVRDIAVADMEKFEGLSEKELQAMTGDITSSLLATPEYQAFIQSPTMSGVEMHIAHAPSGHDHPHGHEGEPVAHDGVTTANKVEDAQQHAYLQNNEKMDDDYRF